MITNVQFDHASVLLNTAQPVHLCLTFDAPQTVDARPQPVAFVAVIDRSGSMGGQPIEAAKKAAADVVRNLRPRDLFGLVVFDSAAQTRFPLGPVTNQAAVLEIISHIRSGGSTNLAGAWSLARHEFDSAPAENPRKILLLTDGQLNAGITDPDRVKQIVTEGVESRGIRTSCLGFGRSYNEDLLEAMANATGGGFHDANNPDALPEIFRKELDGLQQIVVQNLRVTLRLTGFADQVVCFGEYPGVTLPDGGRRYAIGDLVSGEQRRVLLALEVPQIPLGADGRPVADWHGEHVADLVVSYDLITDAGMVSKEETHRLKLLEAQSPEDVRVNSELLPWVALQTATAAVETARQARDRGAAEDARGIIAKALERLKSAPASLLTEDALRLLRQAERALAPDSDYSRTKKEMLHMKRQYGRLSTADDTVMDPDQLPSFRKPRGRNPEAPESGDAGRSPGSSA